MNNQEFNPVYDNEAASRLEFSPAEDEKPRREEGAQKKEFFADDRDAEKEFSGGSSKNVEGDDSKKDTVSRRKRLKMLLALTGTTVVVASSGVFQSSTPTPPAGEGHTDACIFTTEYNDFFEEILELKDNEQYMDILTLVNTSDEIYDCVKTLYPGLDEYLEYSTSTHPENLDHDVYEIIPIYYNGQSVSNCGSDLLSAKSSDSSPYIYLKSMINGYGELDVRVSFVDSLDFSENYFQKYGAINFTNLMEISWGNASGYNLVTGKFTGPNALKDYHTHNEYYYSDGSLFDSSDFYIEYWDQDQGSSGNMYGQENRPDAYGIIVFSETDIKESFDATMLNDQGTFELRDFMFSDFIHGRSFYIQH